MEPQQPDEDALPVGPPVENGPAGRPARDAVYRGRYVSLQPVCAGADADELFEGSHGTEERERLWTYMSYGPFPRRDAMLQWLEAREASEDPLFLTVHDLAAGKRTGMVAFMNIVPGMRRLELGNIWYTPAAQRTKVNTESIYLMLRETFDRLRYRRAEWKCDALNARSRAAARRLGFSFEGLFLRHMIVKGRSRDTAWYAMTDAEWPAIRSNLERWLYGVTPGKELSLGELNQALLRDAPVDR